MLFNSLAFLIFFAAFIGLWPLMKRRRMLRWAYLVAASFFFYGWWDWRFLFLLIGSGLIDYFAALGMVRFPRRKRLLLIASILGNVGSLAVFKYLDFGIANANGLLGLFGVAGRVPVARLILPVGISFYTFQSMSYTIDVFRGRLAPTRHVLHFFAYLSMFPQLVAGPIVRAADLLPQLEQVPTTTEADRWEGLRRVACGYFKKVVIADNLAVVVNLAFGADTVVNSSLYWWMITTMFAFQIYCDFSGYSDIARGLARWMGYRFPVNFNRPYIAASFRDFWGRWHVSLSSWFRDYVYIPLGGSRRGAAWGHAALWITMLASGLWHGAAWTFVVWGAVHAFYLSVERLTRWPQRLCRLRGGRHVATALVFGMVLVSWVFFRATSLGQAVAILKVMFSLTALNAAAVTKVVGGGYLRAGLVLVGLMMLRQLYFHLHLDKVRWPVPRLRRALGPVAVAAMLVAVCYLRGPGAAFIYFQF
jgi:D-alanyl-lipoteichoic acid acyltransferase DltB (MBOAT superfamily)